MLREVAKELTARLASQGCRIEVLVGPEATKTTTPARERIVIQHDGSDTFGAGFGVQRNPKTPITRTVSAKATIYAKSESAQATPWEHERRAEAILDQVLTGLRYVCALRKQWVEFRGGAFTTAQDLEGSEVRAGAVYELTFAVSRGVMDRKFDGAAAPQATIGPGGVSIRSTDEITDPSHSTPETAC